MRRTNSHSHNECLTRVPVQLYAEANRAAHVELTSLDFEVDRRDWRSLSAESRLPLLAYLASFASGTEFDLSQSSRVIPLIIERNEVDELQCFTTLLAEKARFHDLFTHVISDVTGMIGNPERFFTESYRHFMFEWLTGAVDDALETREDGSLIRAVFALSAVTEGILALGGYSIFAQTLERLDVMPTLQSQLRYQAERTESHVEFGYHIIEQLVREDPSNRAAVASLLDAAFDPSVSTVRDLFADYATPAVPSAEALTITLERLAQVDARLQRVLRPIGTSDRHPATAGTASMS